MAMSTRPLRILVVDDDPAMVGAITALVGAVHLHDLLSAGITTTT